MYVTFQNHILPRASRLIGYTWLIKHFNLNVPLRALSCISQKRLASQRIVTDSWIQFDAVFNIKETPYSHLLFAIKHETLDLLVLKMILKQFSPTTLVKHIQTNSKRILHKKIWFYYEFLLDKTLPIEDLPTGKYDNLLDPKKYITRNHPVKSQRHKINNNLLGTAKLCPIVQSTQLIDTYLSSNLTRNIPNLFKDVPPSLMRRAASFLLLADSKASFKIEGERTTRNKIENWSKIVHQAGKRSLSIAEIERLHALLFEDRRFIKIGLRNNEVFLGNHDRDNIPIPEFIGAKSQDLNALIKDWLALHEILTEDGTEPILHASILAFSFVYIHPFEDGNGRIHRYLLHHILAERKLFPKGVVFPISSVILEDIERYHEILVSHTSPLMSMITWEPTSRGNVKVLNDTVDLYRYFNLTKTFEFVYQLVEKMIIEIVPHELAYLDSFDKASDKINEVVIMPDNMVKTLITFVLQNRGKLSKKKKEKYYKQLTLEELEKIEEIICEIFEEL